HPFLVMVNINFKIKVILILTLFLRFFAEKKRARGKLFFSTELISVTNPIFNKYKIYPYERVLGIDILTN
ncbi:hypothetical protein, partial [Clostridioides difficile]